MGGCPDMGGEDGRPHGGAVSSGAWGMNSLGGALATLLLVMMASFSLASCSGPKAQPVPDAETALEAVAPPDPGKFPPLEETKHWSNPYLVIRPATVGLLSGVAASEEQILKPEEVLQALAQLPASAWPYGRAVAVLVDAKPTTGGRVPLLVTQNFGRGRTAIFATGGSWRWQMLQPLADKSHEMFYQQLLRWLVSDTPRKVTTSTPNCMGSVCAVTSYGRFGGPPGYNRKSG